MLGGGGDSNPCSVEGDTLLSVSAVVGKAEKHSSFTFSPQTKVTDGDYECDAFLCQSGDALQGGVLFTGGGTFFVGIYLFACGLFKIN